MILWYRSFFFYLQKVFYNDTITKQKGQIGHCGGTVMKYIFLHGLGQIASDWSETVKDMEGDVLCPNLSEWVLGKEASYGNLYRALEECCEAQKESLHLCGLSLGGILALQYALEHPQKVASVVLIGTKYTMPKRLLKFQNLMFHIMPRSVFQNMGFQKKAFISLCSSMMHLDFSQKLEKIRCRVLVVCGEKDKVNLPASRRLKEQIEQAKIVMVPNAGHEVNKENPAELRRVLTRFYGECENSINC